MLRLSIVGFFVFLALAPFPVNGEQVPRSSIASNPTFRLIQVQVLDLNGHPAARRQAHLIGLSRGSFRPDTGSASSKYWDFTSDAKGRFSFKLGEFNTWDDPEGRPGRGTYAVIVDGAGKDAGAVSNQFVASIKNDTDSEPPPSPWEWGPILSVPPKGMQLVLHVKRGLVLKGHLRDVAHPDRPVAGISIYTNNDLHADSHTGRGGEIFTQSTITDAHGAFTIHHIYPVTFYVGVGGPYGFRNASPKNQGYWLKTKSKGRWENAVRDEITPKKGESIVDLEMLGTAKPSFKYFGRVVDDQKKPVAGAKVTFGLSYHPEASTFEDDHSYPDATADARGNYSIVLGTPWVRGIAVEAKGFARFDDWTKSDLPSMRPGKYDVTLHRKQ